MCLRPRSGGSFGAGTAGVGAAPEPLAGRPRTARPAASRVERLRTASSGSSPSLAASSRYCVVVEQRRVVGGVALGGQRPALDRVGEDDARAVADRVGLAVAVDQAREVVAAEVAEGGEQVVVVEVVDVAPRCGARSSGASARSSRWYSSLGIASMRARRSGRCVQARAVLDHHRVPAGGLEHRGEAAGGDVGDDAVERLAVEVDDPHHLAQARDHRVRDRLPARALVELGVADQRDLAAAARRRRSGRRRSGARARPRSARSRRGRRSRWSSRPGRGPSCALG